jgi:hypothetical protein
VRRPTGVVLAFGAVLLMSGCAGISNGTTYITDSSATLHATGRCDSGQSCTWYWEYWQASQPRSTSVKTQVFGPANGATSNIPLSTKITGLKPGTAYRWVICGSPNNGGIYGCVGPNGTVSNATADPPPDYETFTTAAWTIQSTPNPTGAQSSTLRAVSCTSAAACIAVGDYRMGPDEVTVAERWDGTAWTIISPTGMDAYLNGVSCTSPTACTAVGHSEGSTGFAIALRWDGTGWTLQIPPHPAGSTASSLNAVSCTSATDCTAVGVSQTNSSSPLVSLAEHWDGTSWTIESTPNPTGAASTNLVGVSCTSATACTAVGPTQPVNSGYVTLAERWDGSSWTIQSTPNPTGTMDSQLDAVSCPSTTACTATGQYGNSSGIPLTLAERWDGTSWTIESTPNPTGALVTNLVGVSCTSASACIATGQSKNSAGTYVTLAERWDGTTWTIQATPNPTGAQSSYLNTLNGVACTSATACTAAGSYVNSAGTPVTLAERYGQ